MISLIFSIVVLFSVPYFYKKSVHTKFQKIPICPKPPPDNFSEVRRLSGFKFDRTKLGVAVCVLFILAVYVYRLVYINRSYPDLFNMVDAITLSYCMIAWPIFGFTPLRFGHVLIDRVHIRVPNMFSTTTYPRDSTLIWINQLGNETYACVLRHKQQSVLLFLDKDSADLLRDWAKC